MTGAAGPGRFLGRCTHERRSRPAGPGRIIGLLGRVILGRAGPAFRPDLHDIRTGYASYYISPGISPVLAITCYFRPGHIKFSRRIVNSAATLLLGNSQDCVPKIPKLTLKFPK